MIQCYAFQTTSISFLPHTVRLRLLLRLVEDIDRPAAKSKISLIFLISQPNTHLMGE